MSQTKNTDDRKKLLVRYRIEEKGRVAFIDPCCDEIGKVMEALSEIEREWNSRIANKVGSM